MSHLLEPGDEALLEPCAWNRLSLGDLVALETPAGPTLHRFLGARRTRHGIRLLAKGDRAPAFDRLLPPDFLLGRVTGIRRNGRLVRRPRGIPLAELPAVAASLARGLSALLRRHILKGHAVR
jgi:hypothetical protein